MVSVYILINPINDKVFYVGASRNPKQRLKQHLSDGNNTYKTSIIQRILSYDLLPELVVLEEVEEKDVCQAEDFYINLFKFYGFRIHQSKSGYKGNKNMFKEWLKENQLA